MAKEKFIGSGEKAKPDTRPLEEREPGYAIARARVKAQREESAQQHAEADARLRKQASESTPTGA